MSLVKSLQDYTTSGWNSFVKNPKEYLKEGIKDYWDAGASVVIPAIMMNLLEDSPTFTKYTLSLGTGFIPTVVGCLKYNDERGLRNGALNLATIVSFSNISHKEIMAMIFSGWALSEDFLRRRTKKPTSKIF